MTDFSHTQKAYVLAVCSHKGGTGRTTTAAALAWLLAAPSARHASRRVVLWDADRLGSVSLLAAEPDGTCRWPNVWLHRSASPPHVEPKLINAGISVPGTADRTDIIIADCPSLTERDCQPVLAVADGVVITCLPDPLCLRTIPTAAAAIRNARKINPRLVLLGLVIAQFRPGETLSEEIMARLREHHRRFLLEPAVPYCSAMAEWASTPGRPPPTGPALNAYARLAEALQSLMQPSSVGITG